MYRCTSDYMKLVICAALPQGPAEDILSANEKVMQLPARAMKHAMLQELVKDERFAYLRLIHEMLDKYKHNANELFDRWNDETHDDPINLSLHYMKSIAFDVKMYHADQWINENDRWSYYKMMMLERKSKKYYVESMQALLSCE